jgi:hypothetical protein
MGNQFNDLLSQTLLFSADAQPRLVPYSFNPLRIPKERPNFKQGEDASSRSLWEFECKGVDSVRNVTVRHRDMCDMRMSVCREVSWGGVKVIYQGKTVSLPLTERFLLRTYYLASGTIPESNTGFWQLPMNLDQSLQRIFGFQIIAGQLQEMDVTAIDDYNFMAPPSPLAFTQSRHEMRQGPPSLRVMVCMAMGCAKERNDFEPGGLVGAVRLMPHLMLVANLPVESMEATIQLAREPIASHTRMGDEEMSTTVSSAFFTDSNTALSPYPRWNNLFDYYWIAPPVGVSTRVVRSDRPWTREAKGLVRQVDEDALGNATSASTHKPKLVKKTPRQGEFDNVHMAPKMKLPNAILRTLPSNWPKEITMAPFCAHDCFHLHWRWGTQRLSPAPKWVRGWSKEAPYKEAGAPMVPTNQDVDVKVTGPCSLNYTARITAPVAGQWQVVMHHGAAYAISTSPYFTEALPFIEDALTTDLKGETFKEGRWSAFYWHLRYATAQRMAPVGPGSPLLLVRNAREVYAERLTWDERGFKAVREL